MHDFGAFCYLDVQKTGSSFVSAFLARHCRPMEVAHLKHTVVSDPATVRAGKFFFISARDPLDQYRSLYAFGVQGGGRLRARLAEVGHGVETYDGTSAGFARWLEFVLDPGNHALLARHFLPNEAALYGLQTHRFLQLSFLKPRRVLKSFCSREDVLAAYAGRRLHDTVLRQERLNADVAALVDARLGRFMADPAGAKRELEDAPSRVNALANSSGSLDLGIDAATRAKIVAREWFFHAVLGYPHPEEAGYSSVTPTVTSSRPKPE